MARTIDADGLIATLENIAKEDNTPYFHLDEVVQEIFDTPTVDAVPAVHGRWKEADDGDGAVCSVCGEDFCNVYLEVERFNYCPNCGAKMDLEVN